MGYVSAHLFVFDFKLYDDCWDVIDDEVGDGKSGKDEEGKFEAEGIPKSQQPHKFGPELTS